MNETFWIVAEIIAGIAVLGLLSAVVTAIMVPWLSRYSNKPTAEDVLAERFARGELTRDQYQQMRQDLGLDGTGEILSAGRGGPRSLAG